MSLRHPIAVFILMVLAMSMIWSKALLSIGMGFLAIFAALDIRINPFRIRWVLTPGVVSKTLRSHSALWVFSLFCILYVVSILYAGDASEWWRFTHPKLAFLLLPLSIVMTGPFTKRDYMLIMACMILMTVWGALCVLLAYYDNYYIFTRSIGFGGSLPSPTNHIRFGTTVAACMIMCLFFALENWKLKYAWERWAYGGIAVFLFWFLHILSVRSGLAVGYAGIGILMLFYVRKLKRSMQLLLLLVVLLAPFIAFKLSPAFELKVRYTLYDLEQFRKGEGDDYSDSQRWISWQAGLEIGKRHPLLGAGTGQFQKELDAYYVSHQKDFNWRPQNQWINVFAIFGVVGLLVFSFVIVYPMTFASFWKPALFPTLYLVQLLTLLFEHPLDSEMGTMLFLVLTLLGQSIQLQKPAPVPET